MMQVYYNVLNPYLQNKKWEITVEKVLPRFYFKSRNTGSWSVV